MTIFCTQTIEAKYTFGPIPYKDPYYVDIIRAHVFKNSGELYPDVHDEVEAAFKDLLPGHMSGLYLIPAICALLSKRYYFCTDWTPISILSIAQKVVSRTSNRVFVGSPLCESTNDRGNPYTEPTPNRS